eukprot:scaffold624_cov402-Prasinococcus_capsulatus_cf.AAC.61
MPSAVLQKDAGNVHLAFTPPDSWLGTGGRNDVLLALATRHGRLAGPLAMGVVWRAPSGSDRRWHDHLCSGRLACPHQAESARTQGGRHEVPQYCCPRCRLARVSDAGSVMVRVDRTQWR